MDRDNKLLITSPLEQFEIKDFLCFDAPILEYINLSITTIGSYILTAIVITSIINKLVPKDLKAIGGNWTVFHESIYVTVQSMASNQINLTKGQIYFPFIFALFLFLLVNNFIGMMPYSFASTSHFLLTFFISFTVVLASTFLGLELYRLIFFSLFVPNGCPLPLLPLLVLIELISYLARNISLGLRLAANILSGHMLLNILSGFVYIIMKSVFGFLFLSFIPLLFIIAFSGLEVGIAFIQAQVFVVLTCTYLKDGLDLH